MLAAGITTLFFKIPPGGGMCRVGYNRAERAWPRAFAIRCQFAGNLYEADYNSGVD